MSLGRLKSERQQEMWVSAAELPKSVGHALYRNCLLAEAEFDSHMEALCVDYYPQGKGPGCFCD